MSSIVIAGDTSGSVTLQAPAVSGSTILTLPSTTGTVLTTASGTAATATNLAGGSNGTIPYQSASGTTQMLAVGTAGQVLQTNGAGAPTWVTPSSGGGNTPAFGTNKLASVSMTHNTLLEVTTWTEAWDSNNAFASGRFTPQTAGYYFVSNQGIANFSGVGANIANFTIYIYKNSTAVAVSGSSNENTGMINYLAQTNNVIVYLNGTTDYVSTSVYFYTYNSITPCNFSELTFQAFRVGS